MPSQLLRCKLDLGKVFSTLQGSLASGSAVSGSAVIASELLREQAKTLGAATPLAALAQAVTGPAASVVATSDLEKFVKRENQARRDAVSG